MTQLCEAFNRLNQAFGANRFRVLLMTHQEFTFELVGFGQFKLEVLTFRTVICWELNNEQFVGLTANSVWLAGISQGRQRDEEGELTNVLR